MRAAIADQAQAGSNLGVNSSPPAGRLAEDFLCAALVAQ